MESSSNETLKESSISNYISEVYNGGLRQSLKEISERTNWKFCL